MPKKRSSEERVIESLKGFERVLRRLERVVGVLTGRLDRLSTRRRKEAAKQRGLGLKLEGLESRVSKAIASLERKLEAYFKELAGLLRLGPFETQLRETVERLASLERKVSALEEGVPISKEIPPIPTREVRVTRWSVGVRAPGGKWITLPQERFFRVCEVVVELSNEGPFTAKDVYDRVSELKELKRGMFQTRAAISAMELMGLIKRVGKGENGSRLYKLALPVERFMEEAHKRVQRLISLREGGEAAGLEEQRES